MKHVGKSMFINRGDQKLSGGEFEDGFKQSIDNRQMHARMSHEITSKLKNQIQECLDKAEKQPSMRKKIIEMSNQLEDQLNEIRAEEGFMAQMRAQWRVREGAKLSREEEDKNIENILERTAVLDSAVRAVGL